MTLIWFTLYTNNASVGMPVPLSNVHQKYPYRTSTGRVGMNCVLNLVRVLYSIGGRGEGVKGGGGY